MPDWSSPAEIAKDSVALSKVSLVSLGLVTWEIIVQLPFDWSIISRQRKALWPSFFYFLCRYSLWASIIGLVASQNVTTEYNCQAVYTFNQLAGVISIGSASTLFMLRTIAVWNRAPIVALPLLAASLGQWGVLLHSAVSIRGTWSHRASQCLVQSTSASAMEVNCIYTMSFDCLVLVLTTIKLLRSPGRSSLWHLLFRQGIIYFIVALVAYILLATFLLLNLNSIMNIIFLVPTASASAIVASRLFASLVNFSQQDVYVASSRRITPVGESLPTDGTGNDDTLSRKRNRAGNTVAGIAFRIIGEGIDSMGGMDGLDTTTGTSGLTVLDLKPDYRTGTRSDDGEAAVRMETTTHGSCSVPGEIHGNMVDLEKAESLSHEHSMKSFVHDV